MRRSKVFNEPRTCQWLQLKINVRLFSPCEITMKSSWCTEPIILHRDTDAFKLQLKLLLHAERVSTDTCQHKAVFILYHYFFHHKTTSKKHRDIEQILWISAFCLIRQRRGFPRVSPELPETLTQFLFISCFRSWNQNAQFNQSLFPAFRGHYRLLQL